MATSAPQSPQIEIPPPRSRASIIMLIGMVVTISLQLITGFYMMGAKIHTGGWVHLHVTVGVLAIIFIIWEWFWLLTDEAGKHRLKTFFGKGTTAAEVTEGLFIIVATITIAFGAFLAAGAYLGVGFVQDKQLMFFKGHQGMAQLVLVLYVVHLIFTMIRSKKRRAARQGQS